MSLLCIPTKMKFNTNIHNVVFRLNKTHSAMDSNGSACFSYCTYTYTVISHKLWALASPGTYKGCQILQYTINPNTNSHSPCCVLRFVVGSCLYVPWPALVAWAAEEQDVGNSFQELCTQCEGLTWENPHPHSSYTHVYATCRYDALYPNTVITHMA